MIGSFSSRRERWRSGEREPEWLPHEEFADSPGEQHTGRDSGSLVLREWRPSSGPSRPGQADAWGLMDNLEEVMEAGTNPQKKDLLRRLVKKVLFHDKCTIEIWYALPN
jgi:hypothetical protein